MSKQKGLQEDQALATGQGDVVPDGMESVLKKDIFEDWEDIRKHHQELRSKVQVYRSLQKDTIAALKKWIKEDHEIKILDTHVHLTHWPTNATSSLNADELMRIAGMVEEYGLVGIMKLLSFYCDTLARHWYEDMELDSFLPELLWDLSNFFLGLRGIVENAGAFLDHYERPTDSKKETSSEGSPEKKETESSGSDDE